MKTLDANLGVDIGGTFTDVVLELGKQTYSSKVLTTNEAPEGAILTGLNQVCDQAGIGPDRLTRIIHGTTLATNALIERRGARTGFITTQGFRDVIEMRTESRFEQYDLNLELPPPLIARDQRYTVRERVDAGGNILIALDPGQVERLAAELSEYDSIAVGLLHSYLNPAHEQIIREILQDRLPGVSISLSSDVSPQMREYERFNTTCANAYVKPMMESYLGRLVEKLAGVGAHCPIFLMHSGGGIISLGSAAEFPVRLVESGPAGGAIFAADIARRHGLKKVLSFDMGGTTAKICLIRDGAPKTARVFEVARSYRFKKGSGMPISIPVIDMVEIGAGGGSLAHVDGLNQIRVGPESAGSEPGPACYNRGGTRPAVTDADLVLGRLDPDGFAGGTIPLDPALSVRALDQHLGEKLEVDTIAAGFGLSEIVDENMANAARVHAVENGEDLTGYTMIAFGGAAPLHAGRLCEKLGIDRLIIPPGAGVGSAIGFLRSPYSFEATRSVYMRLDSFDANSVRDLFEALGDEASSFVRSCDADAKILTEFKVYMRYVGQGWEIPVTLTNQQAGNPDADTYMQLFETAYSTLFGRTVAGLSVEITVWSVNATTPVREPELTPAPTKIVELQTKSHRSVFSPTLGEMVQAQVLPRSDIIDGVKIHGPAVITENETTIILPIGFAAEGRSDGCIDIRQKP